MDLDAIAGRLAADGPATWEPWFSFHGDPHVALSGRGHFGSIATIYTGPADYGRASTHLLGNAKGDLTDMHTALSAVLAIHSPADRFHHDQWASELFDTAQEAEKNYHEQCAGEGCEPATIGTVQHCAACGIGASYPCATARAALGHG